MTSVSGGVDMVVDSIMAGLHSAAVANGTNPNPVNAMDLIQSVGRSVRSSNNETDEDSSLLDTPFMLIERELGSKMVVRYDYDDIVRRALVSSDITMAAFKALVEHKAEQQFDKMFYFHQNIPVDVFDEDEFQLAIASRHEPHFYFRKHGKAGPNGLTAYGRSPPDHSGLLGDTPDISELLSEKRSAIDAFGDERSDCIPRSLAARLNRMPMEIAGTSLPMLRRIENSRKRMASTSQMLSFYELRTVRRLWKEYTEGIDGRRSIQSLDEEHGPVWRRDHYQSYQRRMRIVKEIQRRAEDVGIDAAIDELEEYGSLHKVTEALRERHIQSPEGRRRRERVVNGMRRRRERLEAASTGKLASLSNSASFNGVNDDMMHGSIDLKEADVVALTTGAISVHHSADDHVSAYVHRQVQHHDDDEEEDDDDGDDEEELRS
ncbi:transcriptional activator of glycolytic enzymes-domain-containing protein [Syncephalis fuscata]|nr:transcriptional activator of glycolytic enzymes-domain-containing protein [Syncephalis fuscata]